MDRYSKLRSVLALVLLLEGVQFFKIGFSLKGLNYALLSYIQRGMDQRISQFESEYITNELKERIDPKEFEQELNTLRSDMANFKKDIMSGKNYFMEIVIMVLCFVLGVLFWVNTYLVLRRSKQSDLMIRMAFNMVWIFVGSFCIYVFSQLYFVFTITERNMRLVGMLQGVERTSAIHTREMLKNFLISPEVILFPVLFLLFFWAVPFVLYVWIKKRERLFLG